jgi:hypothetical protein
MSRDVKNGENVNTQRLSENNKYLTSQCWIKYSTTEEVACAILKLKITWPQVRMPSQLN